MWGELASFQAHIWNPAALGSGMTITQQLAISGGGSGGYTTALCNRKFALRSRIYIEVSGVTVNFGFGFANANTSLSNYIGADNNGISYYSAGSWSTGGGQGGGPPAVANSGLFCLAWDGINGVVYVRVGGGGTWFGSATSANPSTNTNGYPCTGVASAGLPLMIGYSSNGGGAATLNAGAAAFSGAVPLGFIPADAAINS